MSKSNLSIFGTKPPENKIMDNVEMSASKKNYYKSIINIIDQYHIYNYLKVTDPHFGLHFSSIDRIHTENVNVKTSLELLYYFSIHKHESHVDPVKFEIARLKLKQIMEDIEKEHGGNP